MAVVPSIREGGCCERDHETAKRRKGADGFASTLYEEFWNFLGLQRMALVSGM